jgi:hypothetical protein
MHTKQFNSAKFLLKWWISNQKIYLTAKHPGQLASIYFSFHKEEKGRRIHNKIEAAP